ncbi:radial spoke head 14 homolog [Parambassis ranga]|uniref:Radial spoke head 14 homolog n=1 Tax=Parambassis ranga TaxID=210632 RepID=A0A6P7J2G8_9TELE|nr:radial spoke head 14 homolog [Parambassis ranga]
MAGDLTNHRAAPVAFGLRAVPQLFGLLQQRDAAVRLRVLDSLCELIRDPERLYQTVHGDFLWQLEVLLKDEDAAVRAKTCELLHLVTNHATGRQALLASPLLPAVTRLMDDPSPSCRRNVHRVLNGLALLPSGADALLTLVPVLILKLRQDEEEEEVQVFLLSTLCCCSRLDALPALTSHGISLLSHKLSHPSPNIRREAAATMMVLRYRCVHCVFCCQQFIYGLRWLCVAGLSVPVDGKREVCEQNVLPVLLGLLQDDDVEVRANAAGVIMNAAVITTGKQLCLHLDVIPVLLNLLSEDGDREGTKALQLYCLRALAALAEAPDGRSQLMNELPLLERRCEAAGDQDISRAAQTVIRVITWVP